MRNRALVVGGLGVTGRYLVAELAGRGDWDVVAIARTRPTSAGTPSRVSWLQVDVTNRDACASALRPHTDISHVFHCARLDRGESAEHARLNAQMLHNVVDAVEASSRSLRHVFLMHGMKAYGNLLGPYKTPALETDPRVPGDLSYYAQEDFVKARSAGKGWTWSTLRPGPILGITIGYSGNLVQILGVYGSLCKALGMPLWFPGTPQGFRALRQACDARLLAKAAVWTSTHDACANAAFNISNGELFRWEQLWPDIACFFGLDPAPPVNVRLSAIMRDKAATWDALVAQHGLVPNSFSAVASWGYSDTFHNGWDSFANDTRLRATGFAEVSHTRASLLGLLDELRQSRIIP